MPHHHYAYILSCLISDPYHIILTIVLPTCHSLQHKIALTAKNGTKENQRSV